MGRLTAGLLGPVIGKVGTVIGSSRNGVPYLKGPYKNRTRAISQKEALNRRKFAAAQVWLKPLLSFVRVGFKGYNERSEGFVSAKSYLLKNVLKVVDNIIVIDPALMKVSYGELPMSDNAAFNLSAPRELIFTWNPEGFDQSFDHDQVMLLAYNIEAKRAYYKLIGQFRKAGSDQLTLPKDFKPGSVIHLYMAFIAADRSRQSDSLYLGEIII
ncbi:MAG TPA: DUF6266 family protein [Daejeonella sp.]|uniref:DUF6266 family protein n=1 Tax=Daejeonella sp. TaxID=2805397 RepID=UPI002ED88D19